MNNNQQPKMKEHKLKCWPQYYQEVKSGNKKFEVRRNDRNYKVGDILLLQEWKPFGLNEISGNVEGEYTGEELRMKVTYVLEAKPMHNNFGLEFGNCVMSIEPIIHPQEPQVKSAEEILHSILSENSLREPPVMIQKVHYNRLIRAMKKYASQFKSEPTEELKGELEYWKKCYATMQQSYLIQREENEKLKSEPKAWTPPTDEMIRDYAKSIYPGSCSGIEKNLIENGSKWMRDQYLNSQRKDSNG